MPPPHIPPHTPERKVSSHPSSPSSVLGPASTPYFLRVPTRSGPGSSRGAPDSGRAEELLNVSVRPAVRRARSSSWKLPPRGARRAGRPGGRGARQAPPPPSRGRARRPRPSPGRGEGRAGEGRARKPRWGALPAPPRLQNNGFPLLPPAARRCSDGGVGGRRCRGNRTRHARSKPALGSCQKTCSYFREAGCGHLGPTCHLAWRPLLYFKTTGNGLGRSVARLSLRKPKYGLCGVFKGLPTAGTRGWQLRPFSSACAYTKVEIGKSDCSPHDCVSLTLCLLGGGGQQNLVASKRGTPLSESESEKNNSRELGKVQ